MGEQQKRVIDLQSTIKTMHESEGEREGGREFEEQQKWVIDLQSEISASNYQSAVERKKCIYRVPKILRDLNEDAYTPQLISFGPYHHGKAHLNPMESYKRLFLAQYLERANRSLAQVVEAFRPVVQDLMDAYDDLEEPWTDKERFLELMILDGCCLLMLINNYFCLPEVGRPYMATATWMDTRRLENQLPLLVLAILIEMGGHEVEDSEKIFDEFCYVPGEQRTIRGMGHHLLDMDRRGNTHSGDYFYDDQWTVRTAVELFQAGVSFKPSQTSCYNDIGFKNGALNLPSRTWHTDAEANFLNYVAFENIHDTNGEITHHLLLMDNIIDTDKDVALLKEKGIINCTAGSYSEIASLCNRLTKGLPATIKPRDTIHRINVNKNLEKYCNKRWNKWRASFIQTYLTNPWVFFPLVAAFVLLALTILQTTYTILPYYHKS